MFSRHVPASTEQGASKNRKRPIPCLGRPKKSSKTTTETRQKEEGIPLFTSKVHQHVPWVTQRIIPHISEEQKRGGRTGGKVSEIFPVVHVPTDKNQSVLTQKTPTIHQVDGTGEGQLLHIVTLGTIHTSD